MCGTEGGGGGGTVQYKPRSSWPGRAWHLIYYPADPWLEPKSLGTDRIGDRSHRSPGCVGMKERKEQNNLDPHHAVPGDLPCPMLFVKTPGP